MSGVAQRSLIRLAALAVMLLAAAWMAAGTDPEAHMNDPAGPLCARSAFAHGYLHGYEEGFHNADLDIHMGRISNQQASSSHKAPRPEKDAAMADSASFRAGYA